MAIEQHFLPTDLTQMNEELLKIHNTSINIMKDAQEGIFTNKNDYLWRINKSVQIIEALNTKKLKHDADVTAEYINANYF